jgi:hypothetical protein
MIFVLLPVITLTARQYFLMARRHGRGHALREIAVAAFAGGSSGILTGVAARIGMAAIGLANGAAMFTFSGSFAVVITFAGFGVILGIIYAGLFRRLLGGRGLAYGCILVLCTWYPLAEAGVEDMTGKPAAAALVLISGLVVSGMWVPYSIVLERQLSRWRQRSIRGAPPEAAV